MKKTKMLKILLSLFTLNSLFLYIYLSSSSTDHSPEYPTTGDHHYPSLKPWPQLPSFIPWSTSPNLPRRSCEAYLGNGFTHRVDPLKPGYYSHQRNRIAASSGWFTCFYSETLRSSVCEGGRIRMVSDRIVMSKGGEKLESVIGREEEEELPVFEDGAFEIEVNDRLRIGEKMVDRGFLDRFVDDGEIQRHTTRDLIASIRLVSSDNFTCSQWIEEPTLLVTRFEYANVFHTFTDWYSAYVASRITGLSDRPRLVFIDGHCETQLEETWKALFSSITYAKNFTGSVCFRHAILAPLGYETALFRGLSEAINCRGTSADDLRRKPDNHKTARLSEFGEMIKAALGIQVDTKHKFNPASGRNILFVRREDYLAHPRHGGKVQTRLSNEEEVFDSIEKWASNRSDCKLNVVNGLFAHMSMKEQVRAIQDAEVIIGAHGAGLTHIVSALPGTVILEIISSEYRRPHFAMIALWKGLKYYAIYLDDSYAYPHVVIDKLNGILSSLGC